MVCQLAGSQGSFEESPYRGVWGLRRCSSGWRVGTDKGRARAYWQAVVHAFFRWLIPGGPRNARICLRSIESDLNSAGVERVKGSVAQDRVAEGFQQAAGEILQATKELYGRPSVLGVRGQHNRREIRSF